MTSRREYPVPHELVEIVDEANAANKCRDKAVKGYFKFQLRNAIYFGKIANSKDREFWRAVKDLYPELGDNLSFSSERAVVWEREKN